MLDVKPEVLSAAHKACPGTFLTDDRIIAVIQAAFDAADLVDAVLFYASQDVVVDQLKEIDDLRDDCDKALQQLAALRDALEEIAAEILPRKRFRSFTVMNRGACADIARAVLTDTAEVAAQYQLVDDEHVVVPIEPTRERLERDLEGTDPAFRERDIEIRRHIYLITTAPTKPETE